MTTAVGDSIRSKIGKPKKKTDQEIGKKRLTGQPITHRRTNPAYGLRGPREKSWRSISPGAARCGSTEAMEAGVVDQGRRRCGPKGRRSGSP